MQKNFFSLHFITFLYFRVLNFFVTKLDFIRWQSIYRRKKQRPNKIKLKYIDNKLNEIKECIERIKKIKKQILNRLSYLKMKWASLEKKN